MTQSKDLILNPRRVAKNTMYLYVRMLFIMIVSLITSRILLNTLGIEDYGIYNVTAGFIVLFSFLQGAFSSSTTRFIGVAITEENPEIEVSKVYSTAYGLHILLIVIFLIGLETVGLWYMKTQMNIPEGREHAALWVYHFSVINACILTIRVPDYSMIVAYEKMNFFAICSIAEVILKLGIVYLILISPIDQLISYAVLVLICNVIINLAYLFYSHFYLPVKPKIRLPQKKVISKMFSMIGWNSLGGIANIGYQQGINLILNFFYGVGLNAAMGIANQVKSAVYSFVSNVRVASDPQIIKAYALGDYVFCRRLMSQISRLSHYILLLISIPVIINVDFILQIWLKKPPEYAAIFVLLMLLYCMLDGLMGPLWILNQATGNIKKYQIVRTFFYFLNLPVTYFVVKVFPMPEIVIIVGIIITLFLFIMQIPMCIKPIGMSIIDYLYEILFPVIIVSAISFTITYFAITLFDNAWIRLIGTFIINTAVLGIAVLTLGTTSNEKLQIKFLCMKKLHINHK